MFQKELSIHGVGKIKTMVEDAIINGEIKNDYSSAISFLDQIKHQKK